MPCQYHQEGRIVEIGRSDPICSHSKGKNRGAQERVDEPNAKEILQLKIPVKKKTHIILFMFF